jgi:hypothetical protein
MAWSVPKYSRSRVDAAGKTLVKLVSLAAEDFSAVPQQEWITGLDVVNDWRSSHAFPLEAVRQDLEIRAKKISPSAIIAQRLKRLPSILGKLLENQNRYMTLTQMQDIGGCRAIMPSSEEVRRLIADYQESLPIQVLIKADDYIAHPKEDGYRSVHLTVRYLTKESPYLKFNGHRVEIQIRTILQHLWATAAEMLFIFGGVAVRSSGRFRSQHPKSEEEIGLWRSFFKLMSAAMAGLEDGHHPSPEIGSELSRLAAAVNAKSAFWAWSHIESWAVGSRMRLPGSVSDLGNAAYFLMELHPQEGGVTVNGFPAQESEAAFRAYAEAEKRWQGSIRTNVVLVSVESINLLREAYPNYYGDAEGFLNVLDMFTRNAPVAAE